MYSALPMHAEPRQSLRTTRWYNRPRRPISDRLAELLGYGNSTGSAVVRWEIGWLAVPVLTPATHNRYATFMAPVGSSLLLVLLSPAVPGMPALAVIAYSVWRQLRPRITIRRDAETAGGHGSSGSHVLVRRELAEVHLGDAPSSDRADDRVRERLARRHRRAGRSSTSAPDPG